MNKGFTLAETLVVILIAGLLAIIGIPILVNQVNSARSVEAKQNLSALIRAQADRRIEGQMFEPEDLRTLNTINSKESNKFAYSVDPTSSTEGVFMRATPKPEWASSLKSYFAAVVLFVRGGQPVTVSIICESNTITGAHLQKSDLLIDSTRANLECRNNAHRI